MVRLRRVTLVRGGRAVVRQLSWEVRAGERWAVLGPNGSGKTSLLQLISTYAFPSSGSGEILGMRFGAGDLRDIRPRIGLAGVSLERLMTPRLTGLATVATGKHAMLTSWKEPYSDHDLERAGRLLKELGAGDLAARSVETMSEGERRRVHLARSLMADPELWLLDEPTAGLDLGAREDLLDRLSRLAAQPQPSASVFITHHVEEIPPTFTHLALMRDGRFIASGPLADMMTEDALSECFGMALHLDRRGDRWWAWRDA